MSIVPKVCPWCLIACESLEADIEALQAENAALKAQGLVLSEDEVDALLTAELACAVVASSYDPRSDKRRQFIDAEAAISNLLKRAKR